MAKSREYTLKKLDHWYANKIRRNYTPELEKEIIRSLNKKLVATGESRLSLELALTGAIQKFRREEQIKTAETYFSQTYTTLESLAEGYPIEGHTLEEIVPRGVREEYFKPILKEFGRLKQFVDNVRQRVNEIFPEELTDKDIDQIFLETYGGHRGFTEFTSAYMKAVPLFLDLLVSQGVIPQTKSKSAVKLIDLTKDTVAHFNERIFGYLEQ